MRLKRISAMVLFSVLVLALLTPFPVKGAGPVHGSYMLRTYAPQESDYAMLWRTDLDLDEYPSSTPIRIEAHFYIGNMTTSGTDNKYDVFMFIDQGWLWQWYFIYGAQVVLSQGETEARLFVVDPGNWAMPLPRFVDYVTVGQWYNITQIHNGTTLEVYLNNEHVWDRTVSSGPWNINFLRIGEYETGQRGIKFAYNIYVDWITIDGSEDFQEDFETNLNAYEQQKSSGATISLVSETTEGEMGPTPGQIFDVWPDYQNGTYNSVLTFYCTIFNNDSQSRNYHLDIVSVSGSSWSWQLEQTECYLDPYQVKTVRLYCYIGGSGAMSVCTVKLTKYVGQNQYTWEDSCSAVSSGWGPGQTPGGPSAPILTTGAFYTFLSLTFSLMLAAIGFGFVRGRDPEVPMFFFIIGLGICYFLGWLPSWIFVTAIAVLCILLAQKFSKTFGGGEK